MNTVISQALATGLPVITTIHSGLPDQVKEGWNGYLAPEGDYKTLAEKIILYARESQKWPEFAHHGREHVLKNYDSTLLIERQAQIYREIIEKERSKQKDFGSG